MRDLARPNVVKSAAIATLAGGLACYPGIALQAKPPAPVWYLMLTLFFGGFVLWAFVFAWHAKYTRRPVFNFKPGTIPVVLVTIGGILAATAQHFFVDPSMRAHSPQDYPTDVPHWIAATLFSLLFTQLFLVFAPFDWAMRLSKHASIGVAFVVTFSVFVLLLKLRSSPTPY